MKEPGTSASKTAKAKQRKAVERRTRVIAVANQKGGVGKSTTAVSLGAALAELGYRILVVDLDPQGNASTGLGIRHEQREITVYDVLAAEAPVEGAVVPTPIQGLDAIPSTIDLAGAEIELVSQFSRELRLRRALEPLKDSVYDFVLIDCPPSLGLLTVNALAAADELIVPIQCEYYALEGLGQLLRNVRLVQQNVNPGLRLTGIVLTMYDPRTKLSEQVVEEVRRFFGDRVYETVIPRTVRLSEAPGFGQPITVYDPRSRGAESYRALAREVAARPPSEEPIPSVDSIPKVVVPPAEPQPMQAPRPLRRADETEEPEVATVEAVVEAGPTVGSRSEEPQVLARGSPDAGTDADGEVEVVGEREREEERQPEAATEGAEVEEQAKVDLGVEGAAATEAATAPRGSEGSGEVEGRSAGPENEGGTGGSGGGREPLVEGVSTSPDADGKEALIAALEAEREGEPPPAVEPAVRPETQRRVLEIELEEEGEARPPVEEGVVRIVDRDAAGEHAGAGPEPEPTPKRRWRLFRRGGDR